MFFLRYKPPPLFVDKQDLQYGWAFSQPKVRNSSHTLSYQRELVAEKEEKYYDIPRETKSETFFCVGGKNGDRKWSLIYKKLFKEWIGNLKKKKRKKKEKKRKKVFFIILNIKIIKIPIVGQYYIYIYIYIYI